MTRIIMIRHGETEWNQLGIYQGQLNSNLTENGLNQASAIAQRLQDFNFDYLYSSDLGRAQETAIPVSKACNLPLHLNPDQKAFQCVHRHWTHINHFQLEIHCHLKKVVAYVPLHYLAQHQN